MLILVINLSTFSNLASDWIFSNRKWENRISRKGAKGTEKHGWKMGSSCIHYNQGYLNTVSKQIIRNRIQVVKVKSSLFGACAFFKIFKRSQEAYHSFCSLHFQTGFRYFSIRGLSSFPWAKLFVSFWGEIESLSRRTQYFFLPKLPLNIFPLFGTFSALLLRAHFQVSSFSLANKKRVLPTHKK